MLLFRMPGILLMPPRERIAERIRVFRLPARIPRCGVRGGQILHSGHSVVLAHGWRTHAEPSRRLRRQLARNQPPLERRRVLHQHREVAAQIAGTRGHGRWREALLVRAARGRGADAGVHDGGEGLALRVPVGGEGKALGSRRGHQRYRAVLR